MSKVICPKFLNAMRTRICILAVCLLGVFQLTAQVKVGENPQNINPASILELESTTGALVITRVTTQQMNNISPLQGALVFNTDEGCVFYYEGTAWVNLCSSANTTNVSLELEDNELILTDSAGGTVSVALEGFDIDNITGDQIVDSTVLGADLAQNTITSANLASGSVGQEELQQNSVAEDEIDFDLVTLSDFINDAGFVTNVELISQEPNNSITDNNGAFYSDAPLRGEVTALNDQLTDHLTNDGDLDSDNERLSSVTLNGTNLLLAEGGGPPVQVDLGPALAGAGEDNQSVDLFQLDNTNGILSLSLEDDGVAPSTVNLQPLLDNAGTDDQQLSISGNRISLTDGGFVDLPAGAAEVDGDITNELQDLAFDAATNILTITNPSTPGNEVDLGSLAGGGADGAVTDITASATGFDVTGTAPGFNGSVDLDANFATDIELSNAITASDAADGDTDDTNEIQAITSTDGSVTVTANGNDFDLAVAGGTDDQNIQGSVLTGETLTIGIEGGTAQDIDVSSLATNTELSDAIIASDAADGDRNGTNELQDLSYDATSNILTLSNPATAGNQVDLSNLDVPAADGDETIITAGANITVNGTGTAGDPYIIASSGGTGTAVTDTDTNDGLSDFNAASGYDINIDGVTLNIDTDALEVADDGITADKLGNDVAGDGLNQATTGALELIRGNAADQILQWNNTNEIWELAVNTGGNLATTNLTQTPPPGENRTYDLNNSDLQFIGIGNIRIGSSTTGINNKLHVEGTIRAEGIRNTFGTLPANVAYSFNDDSDTGMYRSGVNNLGFVSAGIEALSIDENQTVSVLQDLELDGNIIDFDGDTGTDGQLLSRRADGEVDWVDAASEVSGTEGSIFFASPNTDPTNGTPTQNNTNLFWDNTNERLGIGHNNPQRPLHLRSAGNEEFRNQLVYELQLQNPTTGVAPITTFTGQASAVGILFGVELDDTVGKGGLVYQRQENGGRGDFHFLQNTGALGVGNPDLNDIVMSIKNNGNVTIADFDFTADETARLHVDGNIRAEGNFISTNTTIVTPDYVFQNYFNGYSDLKEDYNFTTLAQVEGYIKKNHHLPGVTSAAKAKEDGFWNLSQSNLQNLEKIEELFLHTIAQEKKIESLESQNEKLTQELDALKADMVLIKKMLSQKEKSE